MLCHAQCIKNYHPPLYFSNLDLSWNRLNFRHMQGKLTESAIRDSQWRKHKKLILLLEFVLLMRPHNHLRVLFTEKSQGNHHVDLLVRHLSQLCHNYRCNSNLWALRNALWSLIGCLSNAKFEIDNWVVLQIVNCQPVKVLWLKEWNFSKCIDFIFLSISTN
jgi:hypothetical protein